MPGALALALTLDSSDLSCACALLRVAHCHCSLLTALPGPRAAPHSNVLRVASQPPTTNQLGPGRGGRRPSGGSAPSLVSSHGMRMAHGARRPHTALPRRTHTHDDTCIMCAATPRHASRRMHAHVHAACARKRSPPAPSWSAWWGRWAAGRLGFSLSSLSPSPSLF